MVHVRPRDMMLVETCGFVVGIDWDMDWTICVRMPKEGRKEIFCCLQNVQTGPGAHTASYLIGTEVLCPGVKRPVCEADHVR
jgi:hypothetical protein